MIQSGVTWITSSSPVASNGIGSASFTYQSNNGPERTAAITVGSLISTGGGTNFNGANVFLVTQAGASTPPAANILYYASTSQIFALNLLTGQSSLVDTAPAGAADITSLVFDAKGRIIYGQYAGGYSGTQCCLRMYDPATGLDSLVTSQLRDVSAITLDPGGSSITVQDEATSGAYRIALPSSGATAPPVQLFGYTGIPNGLVYDSQGNLYDAFAGEVGQVNPYDGARIKTSSSGVSQSEGMAYDPFTNELWIADFSGCIHNIVITTLSTSGCVASVMSAESVAADGAGNIFSASYTGSEIVAYNVTSKSTTTYPVSNTTDSLAPLIGLGAPPLCSYALGLGQISYNIPSSAGSYQVNVTTSGGGPGGCPWQPTVTQGSSQVTLTYSAGATSSGTFSFAVGNNSSSSQQTYQISVGGQTITVTQNGTSSSGTCTSETLAFVQSFPTPGATVTAGSSYRLQVAASCVPSPPSALSVTIVISGLIGQATYNATSGNYEFVWTPSASSANTTVSIAAVAIEGTVSASTPSFPVTVAGSSSGCSVSVSPAQVNLGSLGTPPAAQFSVTAGSGCSWNASTTSSFLSVASPASGTGNGTVTYTVAKASPGQSGAIVVTPSSGTGATFTVNIVTPTLALSSSAPSSSCGSPGTQKYFGQASSLTIYPWLASAPGTGSDVISVQVFLTGGAQPLKTATLTPSVGCFFSPVTLTSPAAGSYTVFYYMNNALAGSVVFSVVADQVTLGVSSATNPYPGLTSENIQATIPSALGDAATLTYLTNLSRAANVTAAGGTPGAYDCAVSYPQSGSVVPIPAGQTQSPNATFSGGTVAGSCTASVVSIAVAGQNLVTPTSNTPPVINISSTLGPQITGISQTTTGSTLTLVVTGYSLTRDLSTITFTFNPASGYSLSSAQVPVNVQSGAVSWFTGASSAATGGQFQYTQAFNIGSGTSSNLASVSVTATSPTTGTSPQSAAVPLH